MRSINVTMWVTLDGVAQGLPRAEGGHPRRLHARRLGPAVRRRGARPGYGQGHGQARGHAARSPHLAGLLTVWGRRTDGDPFATRMNAITKYVVSRTLEDVDAWQNLILLHCDAADAVAGLKAQSDRDLGIIGSVSLV